MPRPRDLTPYLRPLAAGVGACLVLAYLADHMESLPGVVVFGTGIFVCICFVFSAMWRDSDR